MPTMRLPTTKPLRSPSIPPRTRISPFALGLKRSLHTTQLYINGTHRPSETGHTFQTTNPLSGTQAGTAAEASKADCLAAVDAAHAAWPAWEGAPVAERRDVLIRAADVLFSSAYRKRIAETMRAETDATPAWAALNGIHGALFFRAAAGMVSELKGGNYPSAAVPGTHVIEQRRAMGVTYSIAPWNAPIILSIRALAIPILCGNSVVLRPSEFSPATQSIGVDALHEAGLPKGILNFVTFGAQNAPERTADIIGHPAVRKVTFTGSDRVGRAIAVEAAKHLKPCVLELGSKSPAVASLKFSCQNFFAPSPTPKILLKQVVCVGFERRRRGARGEDDRLRWARQLGADLHVD